MRILITGASRGLGLCLAEKFAAEGWEVLAAARSPETADKLCRLAERRSNVYPVEMDVADWESVSGCAEKVKEKSPCLDMIINNAGVLYESDKVNRIMDVDIEVLKNTIAVNTEGPILVLKAFYPLLTASESPVFMSSLQKVR